ncbi:hypothetical protein ACHAXT_009924 [Thalassiosira profunda]
MRVLLPLASLALVPSASSALWKRVKPRVSRPSGPTNVTLHVVSRTELGVAWEPPLYDGGREITKYLVEWDLDREMTGGIASPTNPYGNGVDGPLVRSEVVSADETDFRIAGLDEGETYFVRVSAYGEGYSNAISSEPPQATPIGMLPGFLTDVSLAVATDSDTADRLRLAWSAAEYDVNGFSVLPAGCAGGASPPSAPDSLESYQIMWDTHPSLSNAQVYDVPAVTGDGSPMHCCPTGSDEGSCHIELGAEVQSIKITHPESLVPSSDDLFDSGSVRIAYVGSQSKSIQVLTPSAGSTEVLISPSATLPPASPIAVGDLVRIQGNAYLVANVDGWPASIDLASEYVAASDSGAQPETVQAYFASPPSSCFDVSSAGNSAQSFRSHLALNFDGSPFDETVSVSRSTLTEPFESEDEDRIVGYEYRVTFSGQGFSSTLGHPVEELLVVSDPSSPFASVGDCGMPFVSDGVDVSNQVSVEVSTDMESTAITPGTKYYVQVAGVNTNGVGPYVSATPEAETPRSQPGLAQNCKVYAVPSASSSLKVEWDGVQPDHGRVPSSYRVDFYDVDSVSSDPVATQLIEDIDESSRYSVTKTDLVPGTKYKVLIVPSNELGEGGPSWYGDFNPVGLIHDDQYATPQDYLERSCHAVPTCEGGSVQCAEIDAETFGIVARSVPPPPTVEVGTYPSVSNRNRFSKDSLLVTFESPLAVGVESNGVPADKFLVEWSTSSSFLPSIDENVDSLWSTEVTAQYSDEDGENAMGELLIDSLEMGTDYFVRVSAHNTAGYGPPTSGVPIKPMTRPDPPFEPVLSGLTPDYLESAGPDSSLSDSAIIGTSLLVSWKPPRVDSSNDRPDLVGDGGDEVSSYLVEWSRTAWDSFSPTVVEVGLQTASGLAGADAVGLLTGSFQLVVDTTASSTTVVSGSYTSAAIPAETTAAQLKTIVENVPNVGEVEVSSPEPLTWRITFLSEVGDLDVSLEENTIVDDDMAAGTVDVAKLSAGTIPSNSAYGFEILSDIHALTVDDTLHYAVEHLVPGMKVFVRISAGNQVGFGPRRKTAPEFSSPTLQRPDVPTSLYSEDVAPYLSVHSPTALEVHVGPPFYDGGSPLTSFLIEWDSSPTFASSPLGDGSSLGSAQVDVASPVCSSCVSAFDLATNTFTYTGDEVTAQLLVPQRKISVFFHDDSEPYTFSVVSATASTITVSSNHLRVLPLGDMQDQDSGIGSPLDLLGTTFVIDGLETNRAYFVRVSSENGEMGTGKAIATEPSKQTPRGFPKPPSTASVSVVDKNTLNVTWSSDAQLTDPAIQAYKVERFRKSNAASSASFSFFGEQEVVELATIGLGLTGGSFHLYFGELDASTNVFLGTAKANAGLSYVETHADTTPLLRRGEAALIGDSPYSVHDTEPFTPGRLPLSSVYAGSNSEAVSVFARPKSMPIAHDATAAEVQNALEQMPNVNHVNVRREVDDSLDGFRWVVTFTSNVGPQPAFQVDTANLVGTNPLGFTVARTVAGVLPDDYDATLVQDPAATSVELEHLVTGVTYYTRVFSITDKGESLPVSTQPASITPGGVPGEVSPPGIRSLDDSTLLVSFEAAAEANGAPVEEFVVETSSDPSFVDSTSATVQPDFKVQRVTTRAHTLPWDVTSTFTLSLGDFHGDFTVPVGDGATTVTINNGDNVLERSTGTTSLSAAVARGDFLSVGGVEFRVCLSDSHVYDDTHLSLCSVDDPLETSNFSVDSALEVIDELPIFLLDTSLGAAKSPSVGDVYLSTVDAAGASVDARGRLRRGDLLRVGHPELGETFRVSTDTERDFTDRVIPLSSKEDASAPASLSDTALEHSSYEIQSFSIRSSSDAVTLTPSSSLSSGYRLRFKSEVTQSTVAGGAAGCLAWDGSASDLKAELEALEGIDAVEVTKDDLPAVPGGVGAGVQYHITFTGLNVRGNVPPLQIIDVGSNGCLDAHAEGGAFGGDIASIAVEQAAIPYVPFYEVQTTTDIPYDASSADMKAVLEALSQACTVDVSREINRHGFSWDVTFVECDADTPASRLLPISANGANLQAVIDPGVSVVDVLNVNVPTDTGGQPIFARVAAVNSFGTGLFAQSNPRAVEVSPQPPSEPVDVFAESISDTEIVVQWNPPLEDGGRSITHYKVEYDELPTFTSGPNGGAQGSLSLSSSSVGTVSDVQSVTVKIDTSGSEAYLSGTFALSFDGQKTGQLSYDASSEEVKAALEELCNVEEVYVSRSLHCSPDPSVGCMTPDGYTWLVTFASLNTLGDQHHKPTSALSLMSSHKLSVDGSYLFECSDVGRTTCSIGGNAVATVGTVQEVQSITVASSPFSVTIGGETSDVINLGDSVAEAEAKLNAYSKSGVGRIAVTCADCTGGVVNSGDTLLLHFLSYRGDMSLIAISDPTATVSEVTKGSGQFVVGRASYSAVLSGLTSVHDWHVRVFAYNGVGEGPPAFVWPSPLRLDQAPPRVPENVAAMAHSSTSLQVSWDRPTSIGGAELASFVVEYDTNPAFSSSNGVALGQLSVAEADADASVGVVTVAYPDSSDPILRKRIIIDNPVPAGSLLIIERQHLTVLAINEDGCGVTCLTMDADYAGASSSGMKVYSGADSKHYRYTVAGLTPGQEYYVRVAAVNEKSQGPFAFEGYPLSPISATPVDVPTALSWASATMSDDKLRLDWGAPLSSERPNGVNGAPVAKYQVEVATSDFLPEILSLSTSADDAVSGHLELSVGYQGSYDRLVSLGSQPAQFVVDPGSRWVGTMGDDLRSVLHPGERIVIGDESAEVKSVSADKIELAEYHVRGSGGVAVPGYRMDNYIGSATLSSGATSLTEANGQNLESALRPGDVIQVQNDVGASEYLTVSSVSGSIVNFSPSYSGGTTTTPIYANKKVIVPANASSAAMKASLESLPGVGVVEVWRDGPKASEGFTWTISFLSDNPSPSLTVAEESVNYIVVSDLGGDYDGNYVQTSFQDGRPRYELLGKSLVVSFEPASAEWRLLSHDGSVVSSAASSDATVPLSGWSNGASVSLSSSAMPLLVGQNAVADVSTLQAGVQPSFADVVHSADVEGALQEIQEVELLSDADDLRGNFELSIGTIPQTVTVYADGTSEDFATKLQALSGVGHVAVETSEPSDKFGRVWRVTFLGNAGDVPLLQHSGTSNLQGTGVSLDVREKVKGSSGQQYVEVDGLEEGAAFASRIRAENEAGAGPWTSSDPVSLSIASPPGPPSLESGIVTKARAEVKLTGLSSDNGSEVSSYKLEWTTASDFEASSPGVVSGSMELFADEATCGSLHLGEFSAPGWREEPCLGGEDTSVAIVAESLTAVGGTIVLSYGQDNSVEVGVSASASEMEDALSALLGSDDVRVTKHEHSDLGEGVAWAVRYPRADGMDARLRVVDSRVTGRNAKVDVYPILEIKTHSPANDEAGAFRLVVDGETTAPISLDASRETVLAEMHKLNGIGKATWLAAEEISNGRDLTMIVKAHTADLDKVSAIPELSWRGTAPRIFAKPPSGLEPNTFALTGLDGLGKIVVRGIARNERGHGAPSVLLEISLASTVPSAPTAVLLLAD